MLERIDLNSLIVLQDELRCPEQMAEMIAHVKSGGKWDKKTLLAYSDKHSHSITLNVFDEYAIMIHDGHHRCLATLLAGREFLFSTEYKLQSYSYDDYQRVNPQNHWVTPLDPRIEVRRPDILGFKNSMMNLFSMGYGDDALLQIKNNKSLYAKPREQIRTLSQLRDSCMFQFQER